MTDDNRPDPSLDDPFDESDYDEPTAFWRGLTNALLISAAVAAFLTIVALILMKVTS